MNSGVDRNANGGGARLPSLSLSSLSFSFLISLLLPSFPFFSLPSPLSLSLEVGPPTIKLWVLHGGALSFPSGV